MKRKKSRIDNCNTFQVIQFSTLERSRKNKFDIYQIKGSPSIAAIISSIHVAAARGLMILMAVIITLFYPAGAYASEAVDSAAAKEEAAKTSQTAEQPKSEATSQEQQKSESSDSKPKAENHEAKPAPTKTSSNNKNKKPQSKKKVNSNTKPKKSHGNKPSAKSGAPKTGPKKPDGASANKYVFNDKTGMWENGTYAWDPKTGLTHSLKEDSAVKFDPETGTWSTNKWKYDKNEKKYVPNTISVQEDNDGKNGKSPGIKLDDEGNVSFDIDSDISIGNLIESLAKSGDASVNGNTKGGNALSGDALAIANIFNLINSSAGLLGGSGISTFSSDIYGDVFGDLYVDPEALAAVQLAAGLDNYDTNLNIDVNLDQKVANDVNLVAESGDASVKNNTSAGSASSGNADAVANIVNMLNSAISSGGSFLGMLNIHGNLDGDILLPTGLLNELLAAGNSEKSKGSTSTKVTVDLDNNQKIVNNINANAASGNATVANNTTAGDATSGDALTQVNIINLTGRNIVAANSLLVFVNVLGEWVGVIMDAPAGSTSVMLGTGVTENSQKSKNLEADYDVDSNSEIVNNINVSAASGDATVANNTTAGDATTGDATASVNLANIINSTFSLADWFGILFINVFGTWNGSFGVDTAAGNKPEPSKPANGKGSGGSGKSSSGKSEPKVFRFVPSGRSANSGSGGGTTLATVDMNAANEAAVERAVQVATERISEKQKAEQAAEANEEERAAAAISSNDGNSTRSPDFTLPALGLMLGGAILGGEQLVNRRQRRNRLSA